MPTKFGTTTLLALVMALVRKLIYPVPNTVPFPDTAYTTKFTAKKHWRAITVRSLAIGQGEISVTPVTNGT